MVPQNQKKLDEILHKTPYKVSFVDERVVVPVRGGESSERAVCGETAVKGARKARDRARRKFWLKAAKAAKVPHPGEPKAAKVTHPPRLA